MNRIFDSKWTTLMIFALVSIIFALPILCNIDYWGGGIIGTYMYSDWDVFHFLNAVPRETLIRYHQIPLWNPYYCGGTVMLANPQSSFLSPLYVFVLLFGPVVGLKIEIFVHLILGMFGMYMLSRYLGMDKICSYLPSFVYMLGSMYSVMITSGMTIFWAIAYIPFVFLYYLKSLRKTEPSDTSKLARVLKKMKYILFSAFFLVLMVFEGGVIPFIYVVLFLLIYSLLPLIHSFFLLTYNSFKKVRRSEIHGIKTMTEGIIPIGLKNLTLILTFTFLIGAIKFVPMISWVSNHPRLITDYSGFSLEILYHSLLGRDQQFLPPSVERLNIEISWVGTQETGLDFLKGMTYGWEENAMYVGWVPLVLFSIGAIISFKKHWKLILASFIFLWLSFGNRTPISLWNVLHSFPIFSSLRVAQRFRMIFIFCLALISGLSLSKIKKSLLRRSNGRHKSLINILSFLVVIFVLADLVVVGSPVFEQAFQTRPMKNFESTFYTWYKKWPDGSFFQVSGRPPDAPPSHKFLLPLFQLNVGATEGYESAMEVQRNAIPWDDSRYRGEVFLLNTTGTVSITYFSPNRVKVSVNASKEGYIVLNQNYSPGWKVKGSHHNEIESINGLISTFITADDQNVTFYYLPDSFLIGCFLTLTSVFLILFGVTYSKRRKIRALTSYFTLWRGCMRLLYLC